MEHPSGSLTGGPKSVLMIVPAARGGTLQYAHNLANAMADAGAQVAVASAIDCEMAAFPRRYERIGVFDRFTPHCGPIWRFLKRARSFQPDVIHFQGAQRPEFYLILWLLLRILTGAIFVWTPQDVLSNSQKSYHLRMLRFLYARMRHVFLNAKQNEDVVKRLFKVPDTRISVLPIPDLVAFARTDLKSLSPPELTLDPERPLVLCFGLIEERKGIAPLIEAFGQMLAKGSPATLLIMGKALTDTAPYHAAIAAPEMGGATRVQIIDRYADFEEMNHLFAAARVVVLPYVSGWNSGVLASAYGYGRPVVATSVGGFDEVVADGTTGLLVPPSDPKALADAVSRILSDPALETHLAQGAARRGSAASWDLVAARTLGVYDTLSKRPA